MKKVFTQIIDGIKEGLAISIGGMLAFLMILSFIILFCAYAYYFGHYLQSKGLSFTAALAIVFLVPVGLVSLFSRGE